MSLRPETRQSRPSVTLGGKPPVVHHVTGLDRRQMIAKTSSTEPRATRASEATRANANTPGAVNASCAAPSSLASTLSAVSCAAGRASMPPFADPTVSSIIIAVLLHSPLRGPIALPPILTSFISDPFRQRGNASRIPPAAGHPSFLSPPLYFHDAMPALVEKLFQG